MVSKVAIITGGSCGIGKATVIKLASQNTKVAAVYNKSRVEAEKLVNSILDQGDDAIAVKANVSNEKDVQALVKTVIDKWGRIDFLVNCAGIMKDSLVEDMSLKEWDQVIDANLKGVFLMTKYCIPHLKKSNSPRIIILSSQAAFTGSSMHAHYAASKAGLHGFAYSLAIEMGKYNMTVNIISPGRIMTDMISNRWDSRISKQVNKMPLKRLGKPEEIAVLIAFLCSNEAGYITGANINISGGMLMG